MDFKKNTNDVDESAPLLYFWEIRDLTGESIGRYVGKAKNGSQRPLEHYAQNVQRLLNDKPYRKSNPAGYRTVHRALGDAVKNGHSITLTLIRNMRPEEDINLAELEAIAHYQCNLNG